MAGGKRHEIPSIGFQTEKKRVWKHDCLSKIYNKCEALATRVAHLHVNKRIDVYRKKKEEERVVLPNLTKKRMHFQEIATM